MDYVYLPHVDGELTGYKDRLLLILNGTGQAVFIGPGGNYQPLSAMAPGDTLYVMGHGNLGRGIGTHRSYSGAKKLAKRLWEMGLPDKLITVKLLACWTGLVTSHKPQAYGERFAQALAQLVPPGRASTKYQSARIMGFKGSVQAGSAGVVWTNLPATKNLFGFIKVDYSHASTRPYYETTVVWRLSPKVAVETGTVGILQTQPAAGNAISLRAM